MKNKVREVLIANVKAYPQNISAAMRLTARQTKASFSQVHYLYYGTTSCKSSIKNSVRESTPCFMTLTPGGLAINVKRASAIKELKKSLILSHKLVNLDKNLTGKEKQSVYDMIFG